MVGLSFFDGKRTFVQKIQKARNIARIAIERIFGDPFIDFEVFEKEIDFLIGVLTHGVKLYI